MKSNKQDQLSRREEWGKVSQFPFLKVPERILIKRSL